jgi:hypothetical protein
MKNFIFQSQLIVAYYSYLIFRLIIKKFNKCLLALRIYINIKLFIVSDVYGAYLYTCKLNIKYQS